MPRRLLWLPVWALAAALARAEGPAPAAPAWDAARAALETAGITLDPSRLERGALEAAVAAADPEGSLFLAEEFTEFESGTAGRIRGIGVRLQATNGQTRIAEVFPGAPAARAGLHAGDLLDRVGNEFVTGRRIADTIRDLRTAQKIAISVVRADTNAVFRYELAPESYQRPPLAAAERLPRDLLLLKFSGVDAGTPDAVRRAVAEQATAGLILDLRGASGTNETAVAALASAYVSPGDMWQWIPAKGEPAAPVRAATDAGPVPLPPAVAVTDGRTRGAAELLAKILRARGRRVLLVGAPTAGDPLIRSGFPVNGQVLYVQTRALKINGDPGTAPGAIPQIAVAPEAPAVPDVKSSDSRILLNPRRGADARETEDFQLLKRTEGDPALRRATDLMIALLALDGSPAADAAGNP